MQEPLVIDQSAVTANNEGSISHLPLLLRHLSFVRVCHILIAFTIILEAGFMAGCGGSGVAGPVFSGSTAVTVLSSSTANDQLVEFHLSLNSLTLTSSSGQTVNLIATPLYAEFMHLNGTAEPLATLNVPQGVYTSATASFGASSFNCETLNSSGGETSNTFGDGSVPSANVTVNLPTPITVTGNSMGLLLDLLVSKSASFTDCVGSDPYSITPTIDMTTVTLSSQPTNSANGKLTGLEGLITSLESGGSGLNVTASDGYGCPTLNPADCADPAGPSWQVELNSGTIFQGITDSSKLVAGMPVDMDMTIQQDGSLLATRVAVYDTDTTDLTVWNGPLLYVNSSEPVLETFGREDLGLLFNNSIIPFSFGDVTYETSGQLSNVKNLPFVASFNSSNMVAGQNVSVTAHAPSIPDSPNFVPLATMTLIPQTINGTVNAIGSESGFTTYTVTLASYDLFPSLSIQSGQTTLLNNANNIVVYADSNTQMLDANPIAVGSVVRFNGLVFNDSGTLRMDCDQVNDGVME